MINTHVQEALGDIRTQDPFDLLQVAVSFDIDGAVLDAQYEKAQQACHPDKWPAGLMKAQASKMAETLNQAYEVLRDPVQRARTLLQRRGGAFWPLRNDPQVMEALLEWQDQATAAHDPVWDARYQAALTDFARAWDQEDAAAAQQAYWWMLHLTRHDHHSV